MLKDISKKLTMKKSFFVTQLEGFFNAISQEYQELIHQKEVENSLLEEKVQKLEQDIENLVAIRKELTEKLQEQKEFINKLEESSMQNKELTNDDFYKKLLQENQKLKEQLKENSSEEVKELKAQLEKLQQFISKGGNSYQQTLTAQNKEALIEEISKSLKR
jgi:phage shock protein A